MTTAAPAQPSTSTRGFWSLIATQTQGAFSDNVLQRLVIFLILGMGLPQQQRDLMVPLVLGLFALPFLLFSMAGGYLADRYSKRAVTIATKLMEMAIMVLALVALAAANLTLALACIFLMATQSALFGPAKYGLLPELLPQKKLSWGNGIIQLTTFLAIIAGTVAGSHMAKEWAGQHHWSGLVLIALAGVGLLTAQGITRVPAADPVKALRFNPLGQLWTELRAMRGDRVLVLAVVGATYFWFLGALLQSNIVLYGEDVLRLPPDQNGYLLAVVAVGIGIGSLAAGYLSGNKIEYGLIPLGALGMTVTGFLLSRPELTFTIVAIDLALLGFFAGFFIVPLNALVQHRPAAERKGAVIAAANLLSFVGVFLAAGFYYLLKSVLEFSPSQIFLACSLLTIAATAYVLWLLPDSLVRLLLFLLTHTIYRIRIEGRDNIPEKGGALFVSNHLSLVDALLLIASTDRFIRFVMFQDIYDHPLVKPFAKALRAIPISSALRPREMIRSLREASDAIRDGEVVCIFAEGQITRIGHLLPFRRGFERIIKGLDAPIVPVNLDGVWGSIFSFERGRFLWKRPRRIPYPVTVSFGTPLPSTATAAEVRAAVQELHTAAYGHRKQRMQLLHRRLMDSARRYPFRMAMADGRTPHVSFLRALTGAILLARKLRRVWRGQPMVGILMPPSVPGALVNYAATLMGKVAVNLNYTASDEVLASCAKQCGLATVVTSAAFLERVKLTVPGQTVLLEELTANTSRQEKLIALLMAVFLPARLIEKALGRTERGSLDDLVTVIFSSGSTGDPKGVMLSHYNVGSNLDQLGQTFLLGGKDRILGILPFFHSFGFTGTLWLPAALAIGVVFHPNPMDARTIGALAGKYAVTFLLATPTFLQAYTRRCTPEEFGSLQYVVVGAEKLSDRIARAFEDAFGIKPLEGYGCTECSPVVTVNTRDYRAAGFRQVGAKRGKIGHPLPGISVRIVDPETEQPLGPGQPGLMLVRGPNVMMGYLGKPEKTAEALRDGWYVTGDIAALDEDGFLEITDRLSRFSKIGGEMVPHVKIEEKLHELAGATEQTFAVAGVPDAKKGERLVVLHTLDDDKLRAVLEQLPNAGLPNLWVPRASNFFRVENLPYLGTGKLDLRRIRETALAQAAPEPEAQP